MNSAAHPAAEPRRKTNYQLCLTTAGGAVAKDCTMKAPCPPSPVEQISTLVVTFTVPGTLVTVMGVTCKSGVEPARGPSRYPKAWRPAQLHPVGGCVLAPVPLRLPTSSIIQPAPFAS